MVMWRHRGQREPTLTPDPSAGADPGDSPATLRRSLAELVRFVLRSSGQLPGEAVVATRRLTDTLAEIVDTSDVRTLDVYAAMTVRNTVEDYLPTTLRAYLALDPELRNTPRPSGRTPNESLLEQLDALQTAASFVLVAARNQDLDALMAQGSFLRTKFSGSDLDL